MLKIENLVVRYGMIEAIKGISFHVDDGEIVTLIGSNGAGKTTTMHAISGLLKPAGGSITLDGKDLIKTPSHKIVTDGLAQVPEGRRVFAEQSVKENLLLGAYFRKDKQEIEKDLAYVYDLFPRLKEREKQLAGTLSGGEQQRVAIARAVAKNPKILLCDEPTGALDYNTGKQVLKILQDKARNEGATVIIVTHNGALAPIADRVIHMHDARVQSIELNATPQDIDSLEY